MSIELGTNVHQAWDWADDHLTWLPFTLRMRCALTLARVRTACAWRLRQLLYRWDRLRLLCRVRPVWVAYHGYCCDTGAYTWTRLYGWNTWRWPGLRAWRNTTADSLEGVSDGPTSFVIVTAAYVAHLHSRTSCEGCGAGNAPYSSSGYRLCLACEHRERRAD